MRLKALRVLTLIIGCAAPALFVGIVAYSRLFSEGWGAFGLAPLFPPLFAASALVAAAGTVLYVVNVRRRARDLFLGGVIAANVFLLWFGMVHR